MPQDTWLDTAEKLSRMLSIAAIPVVLAAGGWLIQRQLQDQTIRRDYVQLALSILQNPDPSKVPPEIREWAVDLLNENSPTKLNGEAIQSLKSGKITLAGFSFVGSSALTPELQQSLKTSLQNFKKYLVNLGFEVSSETISVNISPGTTLENNAVAIWEPKTNSILVASAFASDEPTVLRQYAHQPLTSKELPSNEYYAIESGLASYFPCSFTNHPMVGDKASDRGKALLPPEDLHKTRSFEEIHLNIPYSVQIDGSEVWGGALWQIRELLGQERADQLIAKTWQAFSLTNEANGYLSFANDLIASSQSIEGGKYNEQIREIFKKRGLRV